MGTPTDKPSDAEQLKPAAAAPRSDLDDAAADGEAAPAEEPPLALEPTAAVAPPADPSGWIGRVVDERYRVVRRLGEGGMGAVYIAEHLTLHKKVALKVVRAELAGNGEVAARFAREAMATAQFEHPHVASAIDYGTLPEGGAYFVMQLVRGRGLRQLMAGGKRLPWRRACELGAQVADALSAAKAVGIIHRDLKPDNILVEPREDGSDLVKVLDFGIAHVTPRDANTTSGLSSRELTRVGTVMGTPGYMSPEQAVGDKVDHRADLYALGVVLWEAIAGRELWSGPDLTSVVTRQMSESVPKLRDLGIDPTLPQELDELVQRLTARTVAERPEHAAEVRDSLRRFAHAAATPRVSSAAIAQAALTALRESSVGPWVRKGVERYTAQSPRTQRLQAAGAVALLVAMAFFGSGGNDPAADSSEKIEITATAEPEDAPAAATQPALDRAPAAPPKQEKSVIAKVVEAAAQVVSPDKGNKAAPPAEPPVPPELAADVAQMLDGRNQRDRRIGADRVYAYKPETLVPAHLRVIAELESARGCKTRKDAIAKMRDEADTRYLRTLQRMASSPRSGCGFLNLRDCYSCIRADLNVAIEAITASLPAPTVTRP